MSDRNRPLQNRAAAEPGGPAATASEAETEGDAALDPTLQAHIGRQLRQLYDEVVQQPVPDRFVQLLEELARKTTGGA